MTTLLPPNVKVHLALGFIDMRKGIDGLAMLVQGVLHQDPFTGHLFVFRGRTRANLIKILFWVRYQTRHGDADQSADSPAVDEQPWVDNILI